MGYSTDFRGSFEFDKPLTAEQKNTLDEFNEECHDSGTNEHIGFPSFYCQWVPNDDGTELQWDGGEKFYEYVEWLEYLIKHFIEPWGRKLNGSVDWRGEEWDDAGTIIVTDNKVETIERG